MDVVEMDAASITASTNPRSHRRRPLPPVKARFKVYILDEVHMLSKPAFNALLKELEERPSMWKFIFATTESARCRSRSCRAASASICGASIKRFC